MALACVIGLTSSLLSLHANKWLTVILKRILIVKLQSAFVYSILQLVL